MTNEHENTNEHEQPDSDKVLERDLCYKIVGAAFAVGKKYGHSFKEGIFQNALIEELESLGLKIEKQKRITIYSVDTGKSLGFYVPDIIVGDKVVVELKATRFTTKQDIEQQRSYLRASKYEIGYLINFGTPKVEVIRSIHTNDRKPFLVLLEK